MPGFLSHSGGTAHLFRQCNNSRNCSPFATNDFALCLGVDVDWFFSLTSPCTRGGGIRPEPGALNLQENSSRTRSYRRQKTATTHFHPLRPWCCLQPALLTEENVFMSSSPSSSFAISTPLARPHYIKYTMYTITNQL
jgi:hypothetical protein